MTQFAHLLRVRAHEIVASDFRLSHLQTIDVTLRRAMDAPRGRVEGEREDEMKGEREGGIEGEGEPEYVNMMVSITLSVRGTLRVGPTHRCPSPPAALRPLDLAAL